MNEESNHRERLIRVPGTHNFRDVGGYRAAGGHTAWNTLYRSDALHRLPAEGVAEIEKLGVKSVIDLRDPRESGNAPDRLPEGSLLIHHPIFPDALSHIDRRLDITSLTELIFLEHPDTLASALGLLARTEGATVVHCTAGKDRTGATIALTLTAIGVDRDDVLHDYAQTQKNLEGEWLEAHKRSITKMGMEITPAVAGLLGSSPPEVLDRAYKLVEHEYGSIIDYLLSNGLKESELALLHDRFVA